ncbi:MAG: DNA-3-methyladenine glycosylase 2 family protein [Patescibacteria group bacterium]|nr:DNA-3-methyladenine glycosylase 2 family protein [Patescibacteria group bacterium]
MPTLDSALAHFKRADARLYAAALPHRKRLPKKLAGSRSRDVLFKRLCRSVTSQQLGLAAASAIWKRVETAVKDVTPENVRRVPAAKLRSCGLSSAKVKTLKAIAAAAIRGSLDFSALKKLPEEEASLMLVRIWGVGPWTAEMFLMFALGRADVFSTGDLGLARAMETLYRLPRGVSRERLSRIAKRWSPYRTYAALILWAMRDAEAR